MPKNAIKILAIDPGARELGVAVLEGTDLLYYGVKTIALRKSLTHIRSEAIRITGSLFEEYQPDLLALEQPLVVQQSAEALALVIRAIKMTAKRVGVPVCEYPPKLVRRLWSGEGKATRRKVAGRMAAHYPELVRYLNHRSRWEELYYAKIFDAVAVGLACHYDLAEKQPLA